MEWGGEPTQFHNTHTTHPPFASFKTEGSNHLHISLQWDAAGITILRGNGGILPPRKLWKQV